MKLRAFAISALCVAVVLLLPFSAIGADTVNYFSVKAGAYSPQSDDLDEFDTGFNGEIAIGHYFNPNFAFELGVGHFKTEASFPEFGERDEIKAVPVTLTAKAIYPVNGLEMFGEAGVGVYFATGESNFTYGGARYHFDDDDTAFGFHLGLGANFDITPNIFLGVEGRYLWAEAEFGGINSDLDGYIITGTLGFRF